MLLKLLCLMMMCHRGVATDKLLKMLGGYRGSNLLTLCMGPNEDGSWVRCAGALWRPNWVLARASCLENRPLFKVRVLRDAEQVACPTLNEEYQVQERKILAWYVHPGYKRSARADLVLLTIDRLLDDLDLQANTTTIQSLFCELSPWMEEVYHKNPVGTPMISYTHTSTFLSSPLRMFITTVLLPLLSFIVFFLYVIFFTGPQNQIPYKSIEYERTESIEDDVKEKSDVDEKCVDYCTKYENYEENYKYDPYGV